MSFLYIKNKNYDYSSITNFYFLFLLKSLNSKIWYPYYYLFINGIKLFFMKFVNMKKKVIMMLIVIDKCYLIRVLLYYAI